MSPHLSTNSSSRRRAGLQALCGGGLDCSSVEKGRWTPAAHQGLSLGSLRGLAETELEVAAEYLVLHSLQSSQETHNSEALTSNTS